MSRICCRHTWGSQPDPGGCSDPTGPLGRAGNRIKVTFPSLFPLLHSTLPDSPPDSGSEAYSPQQVNGKCFRKGEGGGKKILIQTPNPASTPSLFRESGWLCNLYQPGENRRLHYVGRLSVSKYPSAFAHCSAPGFGKGERDRHRRRAGNPRARNPWRESTGTESVLGIRGRREIAAVWRAGMWSPPSPRSCPLPREHGAGARP